MRHSTVALTIKAYTHLELVDLRGAVERSPVGEPVEEGEEQELRLAVGAESVAPLVVPPVVPNGPPAGAKPAKAEQYRGEVRTAQNPRFAALYAHSDKVGQERAKVAAVGLEPTPSQPAKSA